MKLIFKSLAGFLVLANHAVADGDNRIDSTVREVALRTERVEQKIEVLALMAPENPELTKLNSMLANVRTKLAKRQAQWAELKSSIEVVRLDMSSADDSYLQECAQAEHLNAESQTLTPKYAPEQFINLANAYLHGRARVVDTPNIAYTSNIILRLADQIFSTRQNISGLTETLEELEAEVGKFQ